MTSMMFLLGQIPQPREGTVEQWLWACAALLSIAALAKGLFVRKPSIDAEFATKKDVRATDLKITELRADVDEKFESLQIDRQRNLGELHEKINGVAGDVAFIRGRMEGKTK